MEHRRGLEIEEVADQEGFYRPLTYRATRDVPGHSEWTGRELKGSCREQTDREVPMQNLLQVVHNFKLML